MSALRSQLNALEAYLQEEIAARGRTLGHLQAQERAVRGNQPEALEAASIALEKELATSEARTERRRRILEALGQSLEVAPDVLTLSSLAERIGHGTERLLALRQELRSATSEVLKINRRLAALFRLHRQVLRDVVQTVLGAGAEGDDDPWHASGALLNAEA